MEEIAFVIFPSGSTGVSKLLLVPITHHNFFDLIRSYDSIGVDRRNEVIIEMGDC